MPMLSRAPYRRELAAWLFLPFMLGMVEGGMTGVLAKNLFEGVVSPALLNFAIAVLAGAPAFANITSFIWAGINQGRSKIRFLVVMQVATAAMVALIAFAPRSAAGLVVLCVGAVGARMCWSAVITVRSTVWRKNYPRADRATLAGRLATVQGIILTLVGVVVGLVMTRNQDAYRYLYPAAAGIGLIGTCFYAGLRVRGHRALIAAERAGHESTQRSRISPQVLWRVLLTDRHYRRYMMWMFVFGTGNIMVGAPLVILLKERFDMGILAGILVTSALPTLFMSISLPLWSGLLNRMHIVRFRAIHAWSFISATVCFAIGAVAGIPALLFVGAVAKGIAFGGGVLGWNLGHHDFAPPEQASNYMGVHVTLTGIRGLIAPAAGVAVYELLERSGEGRGPLVLLACLSMSLVGALGFCHFARSLGRIAPGRHSLPE
ncbi:MAG: MFS transporter [Planctomycetota bacterium]